MCVADDSSHAAVSDFFTSAQTSDFPQLPLTDFVPKFCNFVTDVCRKLKTSINKSVPRDFLPLQNALQTCYKIFKFVTEQNFQHGIFTIFYKSSALLQIFWSRNFCNKAFVTSNCG